MSDEQTMTDTAEHALSVWLEMWNGRTGIARSICSDDFRIHFGTVVPGNEGALDRIRGAEAFATYLEGYRREHADTRFTDRHHAVDGRHGRMLWDVRIGGRLAGGIDVFDFAEDGLIREVWTVGGNRSLAPGSVADSSS